MRSKRPTQVRAAREEPTANRWTPPAVAARTLFQPERWPSTQCWNGDFLRTTSVRRKTTSRPPADQDQRHRHDGEPAGGEHPVVDGAPPDEHRAEDEDEREGHHRARDQPQRAEAKRQRCRPRGRDWVRGLSEAASALMVSTMKAAPKVQLKIERTTRTSRTSATLAGSSQSRTAISSSHSAGRFHLRDEAEHAREEARARQPLAPVAFASAEMERAQERLRATAPPEEGAERHQPLDQIEDTAREGRDRAPGRGAAERRASR